MSVLHCLIDAPLEGAANYQKMKGNWDAKTRQNITVWTKLLFTLEELKL